MTKTILILLVPFVLFAGYLFLKPKATQNLPTETTQTNSQLTLTPASSTPNTIVLTKDGFSPKTLTISVGTTVTWINQSGTTGDVSSSPHPEHTDNPFMNLGNFEDGASLTQTFPNPGTYRYHDHLNSELFGSIIVE